MLFGRSCLADIKQKTLLSSLLKAGELNLINAL